MQTLTSGERRRLRAKAHHLHPVVSIGQHGVTPAVLREIDINLKAHELIKIRVWNDVRAERDAMLAVICEMLGAMAVQHLGKLLIVFRPAPKDDASAPVRAQFEGKAAARKAPQARRPRTPLARTPARPVPRGPRGNFPADSPATTPGSHRRVPNAGGTTPRERDPHRGAGNPKARVAVAAKPAPPYNQRSMRKRSLKTGRPSTTPHGKSAASTFGASGARRRRKAG